MRERIWIDLRAESTRPGSCKAGDLDSAAVSAEEEQSRLLPVLEALLKARPLTVVSVDTYSAATARTGPAHVGAEIVNDVSGFSSRSRRWLRVCAGAGCSGVVLMHTRGRPDEWRAQPSLVQAHVPVLPLVREGLASSLRTACAAGIRTEAVVLDPGYGFGKRFDGNYELLAGQARTSISGASAAGWLSRKSFLARTISRGAQRGARACCRRVAGNREHRGDGCGHPARRVDRTRAPGAIRSRSRRDCRFGPGLPELNLSVGPLKACEDALYRPCCFD